MSKRDIFKEIKNNQRICTFVYSLFFLGIIFFTILRNISELDMITILQDEFGYWGNAAFITGTDWTPLLSEGRYYQMGYSIFLIIPMLFTNNTMILYHCAIFLNTVFVAITYIIVYMCSVEILNIQGSFERCAISFLSIYSVFYMHWSQIAWSECFIIMLMWISVYSFWVYEQYSSIKGILGILFSSLFMCLTHARSLPVVALEFVLLFVCAFFKRDKKIILFFVSLIIIGAMFFLARKFQMTYIWKTPISGEKQISNADTPTDLVIKNLNKIIRNTKDVFVSILGKVYILAFNTFGIAGVATCAYFKSIKKNVEKDFFTKTYIVFSLAIMLVATSFQMCGDGRMDLVVYLRYFAYTIGPVFLYGLYEFVRDFDKYKKIFTLSFIYLITLTPFIIYEIYAGKYYFLLSNSPEIGGFLFEMEKNGFSCKEAIGLLVRFILLFFVVVFAVMKRNNTIYKKILVLTIMFFAVNTSLLSFSNDWLSGIRKGFKDNVLEINKQIESDTEKVYFVKSFEGIDACLQPEYLQFVLYNRTVDVIKKEDIESLDKNVWILSDNEYPLDTDKFHLKIYLSSQELILYKKL